MTDIMSQHDDGMGAPSFPTTGNTQANGNQSYLAGGISGTPQGDPESIKQELRMLAAQYQEMHDGDCRSCARFCIPLSRLIQWYRSSRDSASRITNNGKANC